MTHEQQIKLDLDLYGQAFERWLPDGTIERIDPTTIRVIRLPKKDNEIIAFTCRDDWPGTKKFDL